MKNLYTLVCTVLCQFVYAQPGVLDPGFGNGGKVITPIGQYSDLAAAMAIQSDGKIVLAGYMDNGSDYNYSSQIVVVRYNTNGDPDPAFNGNGKVITPFTSGPAAARAVAIQADGKIVVAGIVANGIYSGRAAFALVRYNSNGSLDLTFNDSGKVLTAFGTSSSSANCTSLALQNDGKIVAAGSYNNGNNNDFVVARYNVDGSLDITFNGTGKVITTFLNGTSYDDEATCVNIQSDGRIVVSGTTQTALTSPSMFALVRYNPDGTVDPAFGDNGRVATPAPTWDRINAAEIQADGKIVVAGSSFNGSPDYSWFISLARYNTDGSLDPGFNDDGRVATSIGVSYSHPAAIALQNDGKIIVAGYGSNGNNIDFAIARFSTDGSPDTHFGNGGTVLSPLGPAADAATTAKIFSDKLYVGGYSSNPSSYDFALAAYQTQDLHTLINPPVITSFSPGAAPAGATVTLSGLNFNPDPLNNIVYFGAVRAAVTGGNTTSLSVTVPTGATYERVTVLDRITGLTGYSTGSFITTFTNPFINGMPANYYQPKVDVATGTASVALGDIDGDGKPDIVTLAGSAVLVMRNISVPGSNTFSTSSFESPVNFPVNASGWLPGVVIGDIDGDGKLDLVVPNFNSSSVSVLRNTSTPGTINASSFATKVDFTTDGGAYCIALGDIDGDGKPELVTQNNFTISILHNKSAPGIITASSFAAKVDFTGVYPSDIAPPLIKIIDIDGDGRPDLAAKSNGIILFRNTATPGNIDASSFASPVTIAMGGSIRYSAIGDLDGDGKPDLVTSKGAFNVTIARNKATPGSLTASSFEAPVDFSVPFEPWDVAIGDLDGDGKPDIAVSVSTNNKISVLRNTSATGRITGSSFSPAVSFPGYRAPMAIGDLDEDGIPELVAGILFPATLSIYKITDASNVISYSGKAYLQGAYNPATGLMDNLLNSSGILQEFAAVHPYSNDVFKYGGTEKVSNAFYDAHPDIVDWVLVELRSAATPSAVLASRAAFVKQDGTLVDIDGLNSRILFQGFAPGNYHIAIRHRNHLGIRSAAAVDFSTGAGTYDFTTTSSQSYQNQSYSSTVPLGSIYAMRAGNANSNNNVKYNGPENDQDRILNTRLGGSLSAILNRQYAFEDLNMDGIVKANGPGNDPNLLLNIILGGLLSTIYNEQL